MSAVVTVDHFRSDGAKLLRSHDLARVRHPWENASGAEKHHPNWFGIRGTRDSGRPVVFELTEAARKALLEWLKVRAQRYGDPGGSRSGEPMTSRQYARPPDGWLDFAGLDRSLAAAIRHHFL